MMASEAKIYAAFGAGSLATGAFKIDEPEELWCVTIKELTEAWPIGAIVPKDAPSVGQTEIIMSFPTENQMIAVLAAFTNKSFEEIMNGWKAKQAEKEAQ